MIKRYLGDYYNFTCIADRCPATCCSGWAIEIDDDANVNGKGDRLISTPNSKVKVYVIPTNEELVIARDTKRLLNL